MSLSGHSASVRIAVGGSSLSHSARPVLSFTLDPAPPAVSWGGQRGPAGCSPCCIFHGGGERGPRRPGSRGVHWELDPAGCCEMEPPVNFV